jgi:hypothetical protein
VKSCLSPDALLPDPTSTWSGEGASGLKGVIPASEGGVGLGDVPVTGVVGLGELGSGAGTSLGDGVDVSSGEEVKLPPRTCLSKLGSCSAEEIPVPPAICMKQHTAEHVGAAIHLN